MITIHSLQSTICLVESTILENVLLSYSCNKLFWKRSCFMKQVISLTGNGFVTWVRSSLMQQNDGYIAIASQPPSRWLHGYSWSACSKLLSLSGVKLWSVVIIVAIEPEKCGMLCMTDESQSWTVKHEAIVFVCVKHYKHVCTRPG